MSCSRRPAPTLTVSTLPLGSSTNLPYVTDAGASCGQDFVNSNGTLDGVSIVEGHEYAETITDQTPAGGWTDSSGEETGDKCAWISPGASGAQLICPLPPDLSPCKARGLTTAAAAGAPASSATP